MANTPMWLIIFILFSLGPLAKAHTYLRPMPTIPKAVVPSKIIDIFAVSLATQTHSGLFRINYHTNKPEPYLIEKFKVSGNQLSYSMTLKPAKFHDGSLVTSSDVKFSITQAIKNKTLNYLSLGNIKGFNEFHTGKSSHLAGLKVLNEKVIEFNLLKPDPDLITKISDIRFAIWKKGQKGSILGAGPYKVISHSKNKIQLKKHDDFFLGQNSYGFKEVILEEMPKEAALSKFRSGLAHDLFFYRLSSSEAKGLKEMSHQQKIYFPQTYVLGINPRMYSHEQRANVAERIVTEAIVQNCFPSQKSTTSLAPPGFLGYHEEKDRVPAKRAQLKKTLEISVDIVESIGSENCLKSYLESQSNKKIKFVPRIVSIHKFSTDWKSDKTGAFIAYVEAETPQHYFGTFNPSSPFPVLPSPDKIFDSLFLNFEREVLLEKKHARAQKLASHILRQNSIFPLFHSESFLIYSSKFKKLSVPYQSAAMIPITELVFEVAK